MELLYPFKLYTIKPNAISYGYLYTTKMKVPFHEEERTIRVYLPEDYDFKDENKRFKVIYMSDGQNIVDKYTTMFGEWNFDEVIHELIKKGHQGIIVVGIDSPNDEIERACELAPLSGIKDLNIKLKHPLPKNACCEKYLDFIFDDLKPIIDKYFHTLPEREHTAIGGSSMGGLMSFFAYGYKRAYISYALSYSPAFLLYKKKSIIEKLNKWNIKDLDMPKLSLFVGGKDLEIQIKPHTKLVYKKIKEHIASNYIEFVYDKKAGHNEASWNKHLEQSLLFWIK